MAESTEQLYVLEIKSGKQLGPLEGTGGDIVFPPQVRDGWSMVLDCRHAPYTDKPLDEVVHFANHVGKTWILIPHSLLGTANVPS